MVKSMKKIPLNSKNFNPLKRDPNGAKVQRVWISDYKGLGIDLGKTKKTFIYKFKSPVTNKFRILTIESFTYTQTIDEDVVMDVEEDYLTVRKQIRSGVDPLELKAQEREQRQQEELEAKQAKQAELAQAKQQEYSLNRAFDAYTNHRLFKSEIALSTQNAYLANYKTHIAPVFGKTPLSDIEPYAINNFLDGLRDAACNTAICVLKRIQKVAIRGGRIRKPFIFDVDRRTTAKRTRMIEDLPAFLEWLQDNKEYQSYKNALHAQLLYGTRAMEMYALEWQEVDYDNQILNISWERVKNRRIALKQYEPLVLPLMPAMTNILEQQKGLSKKYVFPMLSKDCSADNALVHRLLSKSPFKLSSHDVRRSTATFLRNELRCTVDEIDLILDHSVGTVNQSYIHGTPVELKRRVLSKWHTYLTEIMSEDITPIKTVSGGAS